MSAVRDHLAAPSQITTLMARGHACGCAAYRDRTIDEQMAYVEAMTHREASTAIGRYACPYCAPSEAEPEDETKAKPVTSLGRIRAAAGAADTADLLRRLNAEDKTEPEPEPTPTTSTLAQMRAAAGVTTTEDLLRGDRPDRAEAEAEDTLPLPDPY